MDIRERAKQNLSLENYEKADIQRIAVEVDVDPPEEQYILRMCIKSPNTNGFVIPPELEWLTNAVEISHKIQKEQFKDHPYVYVTIRCGEVKSVTDDEWHVDGFSMRKEHLPEQNYIWSNNNPTEILDQKFDLPKNFDPFKHNIQQYFQDRAVEENIKALTSNLMFVIDPYVVHRRTTIEPGTKRAFFRISYLPIEIEDDTCMQNPLLPVKIYNRKDIRETLIRY